MADPWNLQENVRQMNNTARGYAPGQIPVFGNVDNSIHGRGANGVISMPLAPEANDPFARPGQTSTFYDFIKQQRQMGRTPIEYNTQNQDADRLRQQGFIQQLHRLAQGDPNSLAQQQLRQSTQMAQGQLGGGIAARGNFGGAGAAMRQAGAVQGSLGRQGADQGRVLQMQEQAAAQQALAKAYAAQHGQDVGLANDLAQTNLRNYGLDSANNRYFTGLGQQGAMNQQQFDIDAALAELGIQSGQAGINRDWMNMAAGAAASGIGTLSNYNWDSGPSAPPMVQAVPYGNENDWFKYGEGK